MSERILITEPIVDEVIEDLKAEYDVDVGEQGRFNREEDLIEVIGRYDALLSMLSNPVAANVIEAGSNLKIVANYAVGFDNIDLDAAKKAGVHVANTPGVLSEACADLTWALILSSARHLKPAEKYLRAGKYNVWEPLGFLGMEMSGSTLGILGMGGIGTAVAHRAKGFGMNVLYHNRNRVDPDTEQQLNAEYAASPGELAAQSDVFSIHCPLTEQTHHLVDAELMNRMPDHAILINTSRGPVVDEKALADALHEQRLGGAGLDVFEEEPDVHPHLLDAPNCVITPHIASATQQTRRDIGMLAADAIKGILKGKSPADISNLLTS